MIKIVSDKPLTMAEIERMAIDQTIRACDLNKDRAIEALGMSRHTFYRRLHKYGLFKKWKVK